MSGDNLNTTIKLKFGLPFIITILNNTSDQNKVPSRKKKMGFWYKFSTTSVVIVEVFVNRYKCQIIIVLLFNI